MGFQFLFCGCRLHPFSSGQCDMRNLVVALRVLHHQDIHLVGCQPSGDMQCFFLSLPVIERLVPVADGRVVVEFVWQCRRIFFFQSFSVIDLIGAIDGRFLPVAEPPLKVQAFCLIKRINLI